MNIYKKIEEYLDEAGNLKETIRGCFIVVEWLYTAGLEEYKVKEFNQSDVKNVFYMQLLSTANGSVEWRKFDISCIKFVIEQEPPVDPEKTLVDIMRDFGKIQKPHQPLRPWPIPPTHYPKAPKYDMTVPYCGESSIGNAA